MSTNLQHSSTTNDAMEMTPSRTGDKTVTGSPNLKAQEYQEKVPGDSTITNKEADDVEKGAVAVKPTINEEDLIKGKKLAIVWSAFLL
jgi:hypothetical protein